MKFVVLYLQECVQQMSLRASLTLGHSCTPPSLSHSSFTPLLLSPPPRGDTVRAVERQGTEGVGDGRFHALLGGYKTIAENGLWFVD